MNISDFKKPQRVRVSQPSTLQIYHKLDGRVGIAVLVKENDLRIYFTEGPVVSQEITPMALVKA